jgi:peptidyl-prolyl cis-trans isomerase SurA
MPSNLINLKYINMKRIFCIVFLFINHLLLAQVTVEGIVAIVGNNIILKSDFEQQILQYQAQGLEVDSLMRIQVLEDLLFQKLMLHKAEIDSIEVTENDVFNEIDSRLNTFISQLGSEDQLEEYFDKKIYEIKEEMYEPIENSLIIQRVRFEITSSVDVTPKEVKNYFLNFDPDSLPMVNETVEVAHILKYPPASASAIKETENKLEKLKERVLKGESFATLAILYSEDPGSSRNGGLYNAIKRGMFVKEFEAVMFSLQDGEISDVFETEYGYHIVMMEEHRGDEVDIRHILMSPKISAIDLNNAKDILISTRDSILDENLTFEDASIRYSDDEMTKFNGGKLINLNTGTSKFELHELESAIKIAVEQLEVNEISEPSYVKLEDGKEAFRLFKLISKTEAHKVNFKDDYKMIRDMALEQKKDEAISEWINTSLLKTYVRINEAYKVLDFQYNWLKN